MIEVFIVHNDPNVETIVKNATIKGTPFIHFIDEGSKKGKKEAYALKSDWGARATPFALVLDADKYVKAFYTEADKNVINSLINFLNND